MFGAAFFGRSYYGPAYWGTGVASLDGLPPVGRKRKARIEQDEEDIVVILEAVMPLIYKDTLQ